MMQALYLKRQGLVTGLGPEHDTHTKTIVVVNHSDTFSLICFAYSTANTTESQ